MQSRLALVLMSAAGTAALFGVGFLLGLGVMSTPKPERHKEIALTTTPTKVTRAETTASGRPDDRALTPLTPVAPGGAALAQATPPAPQAQGEQASAQSAQQPAASQPAPAPQQQTAAAAPQDAPAPPAPKEQAKPEVPTPAAAPVQTAKAEPAPAASAPPANATPVSLESRNACDVSACSRAYRSFRESDCTYQPFSGPRQVCVGPPGGKEASRGRDALRAGDDEPTARVRVRRAGRDDELSSVVREVERITDGRRARDDDDRPSRRSYHRDFTADGEDDGIVHADTGRGRYFFEGDDD